MKNVWKTMAVVVPLAFLAACTDAAKAPVDPPSSAAVTRPPAGVVQLDPENLKQIKVGQAQGEHTPEALTTTGKVQRKVLRELVSQNWGDSIHLNAHADSIFMGALGAALFGLDDVRAGRPAVLPTFVQPAAAAGA